MTAQPEAGERPTGPSAAGGTVTSTTSTTSPTSTVTATSAARATAVPARRPVPPRPPSATGGALRLAPRVVALVAVAGLAAGTVVAARDLHIRQTPAPAPLTLPVVASAAVPVCPGAEPLQAPEGGTGAAPAGDTVVGTVVAPAGLLRPDGSIGAGGPASARLTPMTGTPDAGSAGPSARPAAGAGGAAAGTAVTAKAGRAGAGSQKVAAAGAKSSSALRVDADRAAGVPAVTATQVTLARTGDLRGLSATACGVATTSAWLVGGGTQPGRHARLLLANPAPSPAVVDVSVLGPDGPVPAPTAAGLVVPAQSQIAVLVDAIAPGLDALAVHVVATSGRVAATLHDEQMRGLAPGGTDGVTASQPPSTTQVVPALSGDGRTPPDPSAAGAVAVRVAVPGRSDAVVRVRLLAPDGPVDLPAAVRTVAAHSVADLAVSGLKAGVLYTAVVESDVPVVASGLSGRSAEPASTPAGADGIPDVLPSDDRVADLAWSPSTPAVSGEVAVAVPAVPDVTANLVLGALGAARVVVVPLAAVGTPGDPTTVDLAPGETGSVPLPDGASGALLRTVVGVVHPALALSATDPKGDIVAVAAVRPQDAGADGRAPDVVEDARTGLRS